MTAKTLTVLIRFTQSEIVSLGYQKEVLGNTHFNAPKFLDSIQKDYATHIFEIELNSKQLAAMKIRLQAELNLLDSINLMSCQAWKQLNDFIQKL